MTNEAILELCKLYYDENTLEHAMRVADHAKQISTIYNCCGRGNWNENTCYQLGLIHDLYEDTEIAKGVWFDGVLEENLKLLTKPADVEYKDYLRKIKKHASTFVNDIPAYAVKMADIWDHLSQTETLTPELKEKYLTNLPFLL